MKCRRYMDLKGEKTRTESQRHVRRWTRRVKIFMEDSLDEIDEEGTTQPVPKLVGVFYNDLW